ncbi:hypothetical protein CKO15_08955 [Halorhodospira abdelmalekii]|nr:hypothetical protein [Halorhodospira abdelmalekii]
MQQPGALSRSVHHSGLFCEHRLVHTPEQLADDFKARLLRWQQTLENPPQAPRDHQHPQLHAAIGALLQRILALQTHAALHGQGRDWSIDLPLRTAPSSRALGALRLRIRRSGGTNTATTTTTAGTASTTPSYPDAAAEPTAYTLDLFLQLPGTGSLYCALYLCDGAIDCTWWCDQQASATAVTRLLPQLAERLRAAGLTPRQLHCHCGWPAHDATAPESSIPPGLPGMIEERA